MPVTLAVTPGHGRRRRRRLALALALFEIVAVAFLARRLLLLRRRAHVAILLVIQNEPPAGDFLEPAALVLFSAAVFVGRHERRERLLALSDADARGRRETGHRTLDPALAVGEDEQGNPNQFDVSGLPRPHCGANDRPVNLNESVHPRRPALA